MGIQGLLPQLKPIQQPVTLARYEGQSLAIDGYAWLHRAAHACAAELALNQPSAKYLEFFVKRLDMLKNRFHINPYMVFDGDALMVKKDTELKRRQKRIENREKGLALWNAGDKRQAYEYFQKCVDVTPEMAKCVIDYCKTQKIRYVVAPFEADAQMVYLEKKGFVDGIISEDSDLLIFGCCKLITKLNDHGEAVEICRDDFSHLPAKFPLHQLNDEQIRIMVCLSGCDYTAGIPKIGLLTAIKMVRKFKTMDKIILSIQRDGKLTIPPEFGEEYQMATFAFQYQRVFCPQDNVITTLNTVPSGLMESEELFSCIGRVVHKLEQVKKVVVRTEHIDHELHYKIAMGDLCPYDFCKMLVNRERKLQLTAKSESSIVSPGSKSIDSFFNKSAVVSVSALPGTEISSAKAARRQTERLLQENKKKLQSIVEHRKLSRFDAPVARNAASKFFSASRNNNQEVADRSFSTDVSVVSRAPNSEAVSVVVPASALKDADKLPIVEDLRGGSDGDASQDELSTDIPSSLASTEIPSSMIPTQTDVDATPFSEEESEILSEVDESGAEKGRENPSKRHCASLADLRSSFTYQKAPLRPRDPNVVAAPAKIKDTAAKPLQQRPSVQRSKHYVASPSSASVQRRATRTLSLSDFVYRGD
ncbi:LADA_0G01376g1_1 [Lachancea dasiensis]|uniref:LADA_0G01376g1_1 n=1 Tax=Lachancea dasiensis TaxID=1072105 RepID=A0A1G4JQL1_9SACH|nr:LADA_0G01376g1_1 [Lachancea dasiensis]